MLKVSVKYSVICGLFLIVAYHLAFVLGSNPLVDRNHLIFDIIIFGLFIFFAEKEFKTYKNGGILHFWQGMTIGFYVYGIATFFFILVEGIYMYFDPSIVAEYKDVLLTIANTQKDFINEQFGTEGFQIIERKINSMSILDVVLLSFSPPSLFIKKILAGFFVTPVISIILRKQPK